MEGDLKLQKDVICYFLDIFAGEAKLVYPQTFLSHFLVQTLP